MALGVRVSLFMDPLPEPWRWCAPLGADRVELYTEPYAARMARPQQAEQLARFAAAARPRWPQGLGLNAGHDLNRDNLTDFLRAVPGVQEVSIGHALIADALELGWAETVRDYLRCIRPRPRPRPSMIYGIGTDICDIRRIAATLERRGERFAEGAGPGRAAGLPRPQRATRGARRAPTWPRASRPRRPSPRPSALGMRMPMTWRACEILNHPAASPSSACTACWPTGSPRAACAPTSPSPTRPTTPRAFVVVETITHARGHEHTRHCPVMLDIAGTTLTADDRRA
jgi:hypothetical protein